MALAGGGAFLALSLCAWAGPQRAPYIGLALGALGAGLFLFWLIRARSRRQLLVGCAAVLVAAFTTVCYCWKWHTTAQPVQTLNGQTLAVRLQVLDYPEERYGRYYYPAKVIAVDYQLVNPFTVRFTATAPLTCRPYEMVDCTVRFYSFTQGGLYSPENARLAEGCVLGASLWGMDAHCYPHLIWWPGRMLAELRHDLARRMDQMLPPAEAGLIKTVLLNYRDDLSPRASSNFRQIGCSHMLAVSGMHMAAMAALVALTLSRLPLGRKGKSLLQAGVLFLYLCLTGFPMSAARSFLMFFLYLLASCLGRRMSSANALGAAVLILCISDPFSGGDLGFALSYLATLGIITQRKTVYRVLRRCLGRWPRLRRTLRPVLLSFSVTFSATLFTLPVQLIYFGGLPLITPLANLLLASLLPPLLYLSAVLPFLAYMPAAGFLVPPLSWAAGWVARMILWLAEALTALPGAVLNKELCLWLLVLVGLGLLFRQAMHSGAPVFWKRWTAGALALLAVWMVAESGFRTQGQLNVLVAGSPESPCVLLVRGRHAAALCLGGYNSGLPRTLLAQRNVWFLDSVFLPLRDQDARAMAADLLDQTQRLLLPQGAYLGKDLEKPGVPVEYLPYGGVYQALEGVEVRFGEDGGWLEFWANGLYFVVELDAAPEGKCDVLVTGNRETSTAAALTLLLDTEEKSPLQALKNVREGPYILVSQEKGLFLRTRPGGRLAVMNE